MSYVVGSTYDVDVNIDMRGFADTKETIYVRALDEDGTVVIAPTIAQLDENGRATIVDAPSLFSLPETIAVDDEFTHRWQVAIADQRLWKDAGTTKHQLYTTLVDPELPVIWHSVIEIASRAAAGASTAPEAFAQTWIQFKNRRVHRLESDRAMTYFAKGLDSVSCQSVRELLIFGDGQCTAWTDLLEQTMRVNGAWDAKSKQRRIAPSQNVIDNLPKPGEGVTPQYFFLIKEWSPSPPRLFADAGVQTILSTDDQIRDIVYAELEDLPGLPSQGPTPDPQTRFLIHALIESNGRIYDPSFGVDYDSMADWQSGMLYGIASVAGPVVVNESSLGVDWDSDGELNSRHSGWLMFSKPLSEVAGEIYRDLPLRAGRAAADLNADGDIDHRELDAVLAAIAEADPNYDFSGDGTVSQLDREVFVTRTVGTLFGDSNLDRSVDFRDFLALADNFGEDRSEWLEGDFDGDKKVTFLDFLILSGNFGKSAFVAENG